jgi:hypothetical protein
MVLDLAFQATEQRGNGINGLCGGCWWVYAGTSLGVSNGEA